jgi:hypothetical protein
MLIENNYRVICPIDPALVEPITQACKAVADWSSGNYDRFEKVLSAGKLVEYPFPISKPEKNYTEEQTTILKASKPLLDWIMSLPEFTGYKWIRGEVATLLPGVTLGWHKDPQWFHDNCVRLHVPINTNKNCVQLWEGEEYHMELGYLYELNNRVMHSATNQGTEFRTHLILDIMPETKWAESRANKVNPIALVDAQGTYSV